MKDRPCYCFCDYLIALRNLETDLDAVVMKLWPTFNQSSCSTDDILADLLAKSHKMREIPNGKPLNTELEMDDAKDRSLSIVPADTTCCSPVADNDHKMTLSHDGQETDIDWGSGTVQIFSNTAK